MGTNGDEQLCICFSRIVDTFSKIFFVNAFVFFILDGDFLAKLAQQ